jgi:C4-dicarboxylate transporter DctM subunit
MFIIAGHLMTRGSIAKRLVDIMTALTKRIPGGLAVATILSCAIFAAISGSSPVTMLAIGSILLPALLAEGYERRFSLGALASGGTLGILIPPSIPLIIYGVVTEISIYELFIAGIIPGILVTIGLAGYSLWKNRHLPAQHFSFDELLTALKRGIWAMLMPVLLIGGIYTGYFSPTEAAAAAVFYGIIIELLIHRELGLKDLYGSFVDAARLLGMLVPIVAVAISLKTLLTIEQVPQNLTAFITTMVDSKIAFLLAMNLLLLVVGCLFDALAAILVLGPLLMVAGRAYGIDPVHLGVIMVINLEIGFLTPPVGMNLIVATTAFGAKFKEMCVSVLPFIAVLLVILAIVSFVPETALFLLDR